MRKWPDRKGPYISYFAAVYFLEYHMKSQYLLTDYFVGQYVSDGSITD